MAASLRATVITVVKMRHISSWWHTSERGMASDSGTSNPGLAWGTMLLRFGGKTIVSRLAGISYVTRQPHAPSDGEEMNTPYRDSLQTQYSKYAVQRTPVVMVNEEP